jgi:hypothetical protein
MPWIEEGLRMNEVVQELLASKLSRMLLQVVRDRGMDDERLVTIIQRAGTDTLERMSAAVLEEHANLDEVLGRFGDGVVRN